MVLELIQILQISEVLLFYNPQHFESFLKTSNFAFKKCSDIMDEYGSDYYNALRVSKRILEDNLLNTYVLQTKEITFNQKNR